MSAGPVAVSDVRLEGQGIPPGHMPAGGRQALVSSGNYGAVAARLAVLLSGGGDAGGKNNGVDGMPLIQPVPLAIDCRIQPVESHPIHYLDHGVYKGQYCDWLDWLGRLEDLLDQGKGHVYKLYCFRSVSKAIPMVGDASGGSTSVLYKETFAILQPTINKIKELMLFSNTLQQTFIDIVKVMLEKDWRSLPVPDSVFLALVRIVDLLQKLDNLKDMKASLNNDFARFKRAFHAIKADLTEADEVAEVIHQINLFLASPLYAKNLIFHSFRAELKKQAPGYEDIALHLLAMAQDCLSKEQYVLPEEKHQLLRALPHLLWLIDGDYQLKKGAEAAQARGGKAGEPVNVFKHRAIRLGPLQELFKRYPVVPEFADMTFSLGHALKEAPHYDPENMDRAWGRHAGDEAKMGKAFDLRSEWKAMRAHYDAFLAKFTLVTNGVRDSASGPSNAKADSLSQGKLVFDTVLEGLRYLQRWSSAFHELLAWKSTHPCPIDVAEKLGGKRSTPGFEYECVGKYNYSKAELSVMVEVISMCKSLASVMAQAEPALGPILRLYIHKRVQVVVQGDLVPVLHRVFKWKTPLLAPLLEVRQYLADWNEGAEPVDDYKKYRRSQGPVTAKPPSRVVTNSMTQLQLLRSTLKSVLTLGKVGGGGGCFGARRDLAPEEVGVLTSLSEESLWYPYLLDYRAVLEQSSDFSSIWFREFYLELTRQIQFPIAMSLPWILTEHVIQHHDVEVPLVESTLHLLDIYNDAAQRSLYVLDQQFLYDEIEAELNLVFDQFTYQTAEDVYAYFKNYAASNILDKVYKKRLDNTQGDNWLQQPRRRFHVVLQQRAVKLLGRSVDLNYILADHLNRRLASDLETALKRFESQDPSGVMDLDLALCLLRATHELLSEHTVLPPFDSILHDVNESGGLSSGSGVKSRMALHVLDTLVSDLLPNFSYNLHTSRFIRSPEVGRKVSYNPGPKGNAPLQLLGELCYKAFEHQARLWRGHFGREHLSALYRLLGPSLGQVLQEVMTYMEERVFFLKVYIAALLPGIPPIKLPKFIFKSGGVYGAFETLLTPLLEYDDLKPEVFQLFREVGNAMAFLRDLSDVLDLADVMALIQTAPFLGVRPTPQGFSQLAPAESPLVKQAKAWQEVVVKRQLNTIGRTSAPVRSFVADVTRWTTQLGSNAAQSKSLFHLVLRRFDYFISAQGMKEEWAGPEPENGVLEVEAPKEFHRFWSAMSFLYSCDEPPLIVQRRGKQPTDDEQFGHGFTIAGAALVYLLGQREKFDLLDFSQHVLNVQEYETQSAKQGGESSKVGMVEVGLQQAAKNFLGRAARQRDVHRDVFAMMERDYPIGPPAELLIFHPPKTL